MSKFSRVLGHGTALLFIAMGLGFVALGLNERFGSWLDANSACNGGSCPDGAVRTTFLILGISFIAVGVIISVAVEFALRKTSRILSRVSAVPVAASPVTSSPVSAAPTIETIGELLESRGIHLSESLGELASIRPQVIDLRGQRSGGAPADPVAIGDYLKMFGISVDPAKLRNAQIIGGSDLVQAETLASVPPEFAPPAANLLRETATIVHKRDRGETVGNQRLLELELEVTPIGRVPYRVTVASLVRESLAGLLIEGATVNVRVDEHNPDAVTIDWSEN